MIQAYFHLFFVLIAYATGNTTPQFKAKGTIKWCTISQIEQEKCNDLAFAISQISVLSLYNLVCVQGSGIFDCMDKINKGRADLATFDTGLGYYGYEIYSLRPVAVENYADSNNLGMRNLYYDVEVIVPKNSDVTPFNMKGRSACFSGVGTAEGWIIPLSILIGDLKSISVSKCNSLIQAMQDVFDYSCAPGALEEPFNIFGDNSPDLCRRCKRQSTDSDGRYCTYTDPFAGSQGALQCLYLHQNGNITVESGRPLPTVAFVRAGEAYKLAQKGEFPIDNYELLCKTQQAGGSYRAKIAANSSACSWGRVSSRMVMTAMTRSNTQLTLYTEFIRDITNSLRVAVSFNNETFGLFDSQKYGSVNLMFSDFTKNIYIPAITETETYYRWIDTVDKPLSVHLEQIKACPHSDIRWCVISDDEMYKCEKMKSALDAKSIKPEFNCIRGKSTTECMKLIEDGYADLMTVDAADLYVAGTKFNLVPIATEYYGDRSNYTAVAIVKKIDPYLTIASLKFRKTCHSGIGKATGWVIPINLILETKQVNVYQGRLLYAFSELVSRSCIPGAIDTEYNTNWYNGINLCEVCAAGNQWKCARDTRENYYGDSGAFRCLIENGDVAFAKHTTVRENTGGRNQVEWARNRRMHDYELLCQDGSRNEVQNWDKCNLGVVPGNTVITANHKTATQRESLWRLLRYAQGYYSSDENPIFSMFKSPFGRNDIMFSDSAVSLRQIPSSQQDYKLYLGRSFIRQVENLYHLASYGQSGMYNTAVSPATSAAFSMICLSLVPAFLLRMYQ